MALELIQTVAPCITYEPETGGMENYWAYNPYLTNPPRHYRESLKSLKQFFYDPTKDVFVTFAILDYAYWPSWRMARYVWNAVDGSLNATYTTHDGIGILFSHWTNDICVGGYDKFYATGCSFLDVKEVDWVTQEWLTFSCYNWQGRDPIAFSHAIVNRVDKIVAGIGSSPMLYVYNFETHDLLGKVAIRDCGYNMAYESDKNLWVVHASGNLAKINYLTRCHEMLSRVANPSAEDLSYRCAFDTRRKRLAILRHKPDAGDGACRVQIEFYNPYPKAKLITAPVPVTSLMAETQITFAGHVLGDAGEGIAAQAVNASLVEPAIGQLTGGMVYTGQNGSFNIGYLGPGGSPETLTVDTEV